MDAEFLNVLENRKYYMTKDTGDLTQFNAVACREYTLPKNQHHNRKDESKETPKLLHGEHGVEIRIMSLNRDSAHSWVTISHWSNKFVMDLNNNDAEIPEEQLEEYALQLDAKDFACRTKQKQNHKEENLGSSPRIVPWKEGIGLISNLGNILSTNTKFRRK